MKGQQHNEKSNKSHNKFFILLIVIASAAGCNQSASNSLSSNSTNSAEESTDSESSTEDSMPNETAEITENEGISETDTRIDLFSSKIDAEGIEYEINAYMYNKTGETAGEIMGEVALELCSNGKFIHSIVPYIGYLGQSIGKTYTKEQYEDYFKVIKLESSDVFAFTYPEECGLMTTGFFFVDNGKLVMMKRYFNEKEQKELEKEPHAYSVVGKTCFMLPEKFRAEGDSVIFELDKDFSEGESKYLAGEVPLSFDFENNIVKCEREEYNGLVYYE